MDLEVVSGGYGSYILTYTDEEDVAIDTTGWEFSLYAKKDVADLDADAIISLDNTAFTNGGATGIVTFKILARDDSDNALAVEDLFHQIKVIYDPGSYNYPQTHFEGKFSITKTSKQEV